MTSDIDRADARMLALARDQEAEIRDPEVRASWPVVVEAIRRNWLSTEGWLSLRELIAALERGDGAGAEEYDISVDEQDPARVCVSLASRRRYAPLDAMLRELRRLDSRARGVPPADAPPPSGSGRSTPDADAVREAMARLLEAAGPVPARDPEATERIRREAESLLARLADSPHDVEADARRALEGADEADRARMAQALRAFADWAERPHAAGRAADEAVRALDEAFGWLLPGRRAEEQAREERIRSSAQGAIARRLGRQDPPA